MILKKTVFHDVRVFNCTECYCEWQIGHCFQQKGQSWLWQRSWVWEITWIEKKMSNGNSDPGQHFRDLYYGRVWANQVAGRLQSLGGMVFKMWDHAFMYICISP